MWRIYLAALIGCAMAGCHPVHISSDFVPAEAAHVFKEGRGRIDGQAFLRRDYGRLVTGAGERVFLFPATRYAVERFSAMFGGELRSYFGNDVEPTPASYLHFRRETKVDMTGKFTFEKLWPGRYIVATRIYWREPRSYLTHGGAVYDVVEVKPDETTAVILSGK